MITPSAPVNSVSPTAGGVCAQESYIIHYGLHCAVGSFKFTKYSFGGFDANACSGKTFGDPPAPRHTERRCLRAVELWNSVSSHRMP